MRQGGSMRSIPRRFDSATGSRLVALIGVCLIVLLTACAAGPPDRPGTSAHVVRSVTIEGVTAFDINDILDALETTENSFNPFSRTQWLNRFAVSSDIERIETFYHLRGFFDAKVVSHSVELEEGGRRGSARVTFVVEEGERTQLVVMGCDTRVLYNIDGFTLIRGIGYPRDMENRCGQMMPNEAARANPQDWLARRPVPSQGIPFDQTVVESARVTLRRRLLENGYAYARVDARVYVDRVARTAEVYYFFDQGPSCLYGDVSIEGNRQIPDELILTRIPIAPDNAYKHSQLRRTQVDLYDLNVFSLVQVEPQLETRSEGTAWLPPGGAIAAPFDAQTRDLDDLLAQRGMAPVWTATDPEHVREVQVASLLDRLESTGDDTGVCRVPILITVSEQPGASYRVGGGLGIQSGRTEAYGRANALWRNVLSPLNQLEADMRLGYAWLPSLITDEPLIDGVIGIAGLSYRRPRAILNYFDFNTGVRFERNLRDDYAFLRPTATIGIARRLTEFTRFDLSYSVDIVRTDDDLDFGGTSCQSVPDQYQLSRFNANLQADRRDNPLNARRGFFGEIAVETGIDGPIGDFPYLLVRPEARYYQPVSRRLSIGARLAVGTLFDFGGNVPRSQCLYLGGGDTIRGFAERRLSPYENGVATGGLTSWLFNIEPRFEIGRNWLYGVVFLDMGAISSAQFTFPMSPGGAEGMQMATGGGLRLLTPIGPIRLDLGYRLTTGPEYPPGFRDRLAFFLSIGEAF